MENRVDYTSGAEKETLKMRLDSMNQEAEKLEKVVLYVSFN
jgi:hypothetical protein